MKKPEKKCENCVHFRNKIKISPFYCRLAEENKIPFPELLENCYQKPWKYYRWDGSEEGK